MFYLNVDQMNCFTLNCNMMSMTLEKLLAQRKKQVAELCDIASRDIVKHDIAEGDRGDLRVFEGLTSDISGSWG